MKNVPKSIDDMGLVLFNTPGSEMYSSIEYRPDLIKGRFVPDELLRERFAFAGEVRLTNDEVHLLCDWLDISEGDEEDECLDDLASSLCRKLREAADEK